MFSLTVTQLVICTLGILLLTIAAFVVGSSCSGTWPLGIKPDDIIPPAKPPFKPSDLLRDLRKLQMSEAPPIGSDGHE